MTKIKFPYRAKVDGLYYMPGTIISVEDAEAHVKNGAVVVESAAAAPDKPTRKKTAKSSAAK